MKKFLLAIAILAVSSFTTNTFAQRYSQGRVGILGGFTSSSTKIKDANAKSISLYHVGLTTELPIGGGFAFQPSLLYQMKGISLDKWKDAAGKDIVDSFETKVGYLEVPLQLQWGPDLLLFRPYAFVEPFVGYRLTKNASGVAKNFNDELKKVEYGLSLGAGLDVWILQVSVKYFWNFGNIYQTGDTAAQTIKGLGDGNNFNGVALSVGLLF